ncbi:MAG: T9SS type A sorting domain-containing protein [Agriterribacter sp.]
MKKCLLFLGQVLLCSIPFAQENITYTKMADSLLSPVSKTQITTGILYDRVAPFAGLHSFKSTDTSFYLHFKQAYSELYHAAYNHAAMAKAERIDTVSAAMYYTSNVVPVGVLYYDFNLVDTLAITNNLFYKGADSLLHDVAGRTGNPFKLKNITLATALASDTLDYGNGSITFKYSSQLFMTNKGVSITSIYADFGSGNQNLTSGSNVTASFSGSGVKTIKFTITYSNHQTVMAYSKIYLKAQPVASRFGKAIMPDVTVDFDDTEYGYQGYGETAKKYNRGRYGIYYHKTSPNGPKEMVFKKPIIVLDGFDPTEEREIPTLYGIYLQYTEAENFGDNMVDKGYDVIVLNFPKKEEGTVIIPGVGTFLQERPQGADFIQRNAFLLVTLIKKINQELVANGSTEKLVIIGPSMGGLISRYALRWMELNGFNHNTRLWISFDAPHKGANIPIGDQYFIDFFATKTNNEAAKLARDGSLNSPAAKQMLLHHFEANSTTPVGAANFRNAWQTELDNLGYPQNLRRIALINGAINGTTQGTACENVYKMNVQVYTPNVFFFFAGFINVANSNIWFTGNNGNACQVFKGWAKVPLISSSKSAAAPASSKSYDILPGGYFNAQEELGGYSRSDLLVHGLGFLTGFFGMRTYTNTQILNPNHCFIPTFSALGMDLTNKDLSENLYNRDLSCSGETPFQAYYAPTTNEEHITLTPENVAWIKNEIDDIPQMSTVNYEALYPVVKTSGGDPVCSTSTYQINNLPAGSTVSWQSSNTAVAIVSATGNPATITRQGSQSGTVTFTATINRGCGSPVVLSKTLTIGSPSFPYSVAGASPANPSGAYTYTLQTTPSNKIVSSIIWTIPSGWSITMGQGTKNLKVTTGTKSGNVQVSFNDACGLNWGTYKYVKIGPGGLNPGRVASTADTALNLLTGGGASGEPGTWAIAPNPAQTTITIRQNPQPGTTGIKEVKIFDVSGKLRQQKKINAGLNQVELNVSELPAGVYFVEISNEVRKEQKKIVIIR